MEILKYKITNNTPKHVADILSFYQKYVQDYKLSIDSIYELNKYSMYELSDDIEYDIFLVTISTIHKQLNDSAYKHFDTDSGLYSSVCDLWESISLHFKHTELWRVLIYGYKMTDEYQNWVYSLSVHISNNPFENHQENIYNC